MERAESKRTTSSGQLRRIIPPTQRRCKKFMVNEDQKIYVVSVGESTHRTELLVKMITSGYGKKDDWLVKGKINRHFWVECRCKELPFKTCTYIRTHTKSKKRRELMSTNRKKASEGSEFWAYFLEFSSFPFPPPAAIQSSEIPKFSSASSSATLISWNKMQNCWN